jgi:hypothetical protein
MELKIEFLKTLLESDQAFKELQKLAKKYDKSEADWVDKFYNENEKEIEKLVKNYKIDWDELGSMLMKL